MTSRRIQNYTSLLLPVLAGILAVRIVSLWFNNSELFFDEAQYWFWAQDLEFGYFSKPPLLAWVIASSTSVCGSDSAFCVRLAAPILHTVTAILVYLSAKRLFDSRVGFWSGFIYATLPAVSLSSTIISTDVPLLLCWSAALYSYIRLGEKFELRWALALGLAVGLGVNAKYAMVFFVGCGIIHMLVEQQNYTPARKFGFWLAIIIAALMIVPNIIWNLENGFVTVTHTGDNIGWKGFDPNWSGLIEFFGSQFGVFGPILFSMFLATFLRMFGDSISNQHRLLISFSVPVLLVILMQAVLSKAYANWAAVTYVAASILVAEILVNRVPAWWLKTSNALHVLVFAGIAIAVCFAAPGQLVLPDGREPFSRTQGASLIAAEAGKLLDEREYNGLITTDRKLSALMHYNLRHREEAILAWKNGVVARDHFQLKVAFQDSPRDPALAISRSKNPKQFGDVFDSVTELGERNIEAGEIEKVYFFRLEGHESFK